MLLYITFIIIGILLFISSIRRLQNKINFVRHAERAIGKVVRVEEVNDNDGVYYRPVFELTTRNSTIIEYRHSTSSSSEKAWSIGDTKTFIYDPAHPDQARFLSYQIFQFTVLLLGISISLLVIGSGYFLSRYFLGTG